MPLTLVCLRNLSPLFSFSQTYFERSKYKPALEKYRQAAALWDHPSVHFNIAVCLINLDRPVEAQGHLEKAMKYGAAPFGDDLHTQGRVYQQLLRGSLSRLEVVTSQPGVRVSFMH